MLKEQPKERWAYILHIQQEKTVMEVEGIRQGTHEDVTHHAEWLAEKHKGTVLRLLMRPALPDEPPGSFRSKGGVIPLPAPAKSTHKPPEPPEDKEAMPRRCIPVGMYKAPTVQVLVKAKEKEDASKEAI